MPASRRLHFTFLAKRLKKVTPEIKKVILRCLQQLGCLAGHSSVQGCWSNLLAQKNKAQLFPGVSSSFCNSPVGRAAQSQRAGSALGPAGWSLLVARTAWKGPSSKTVTAWKVSTSKTVTAWKGPESKTETASKGPTSKTVPIARSVDLSHARCWGSCHLQPGPSLPFTSDVLL